MKIKKFDERRSVIVSETGFRMCEPLLHGATRRRMAEWADMLDRQKRDGQLAPRAVRSKAAGIMMGQVLRRGAGSISFDAGGNILPSSEGAAKTIRYELPIPSADPGLMQMIKSSW